MVLSQMKKLGNGAIRRYNVDLPWILNKRSNFLLRNVEHLPVIVRHLHGDTEDTDREITGPGMVDKSEEYLGVAMVVQTSKHDCGGQSAPGEQVRAGTAAKNGTPPHRRVVKAGGVDALERG